MKRTYYLSGAERAEGVQRLFVKIANHYDLINDIQSMGAHRIWKRRLVAKAVKYRSLRYPPKSHPLHILDLCSGTGDIAIALAQKGFQVLGVDFSAEMLEIARNRASQLSLSSLEWKEADVFSLQFPGSSYDLITCAYGLRNLSDIPLAIRRVYQWLKPGGMALFLDFGKPKNTVLKLFFRLYLKLVVPVFGLILCRDAKAYSYILDSLEHYPAQEGVDQLLRKTGFSETGWDSFVGGTMCLNYATKPLEHS
ncbi:MAG TPA: ubiquinone/menaquinone biosynthesis methyltransferase [Verrucomicrobiota bacterium]|nr:ubiquinone/menaquinone biosynthesis methyltransferase [Verrucomicrobiota bacterium]